MAFQFTAAGKLKAPTAEELALADAESAIIVLDRGMQANNTPYWVYLAVPPSAYGAFLAICRSGTPFMHADYGQIIAYGFDADVPAAIQDQMQREHGFDDHYLDHLLEKLKKAQTAAVLKHEEQRLTDIVAMIKAQQKKPSQPA